MFTSRTRFGAITALALTTAMLATGCASADDAAESTPSTEASSGATPTAGEVDTDSTAEPEVPVVLVTPTCEEMIGENVVDDFMSIGWTAKAETFYLGNIEVADGVQCIWADYSGTQSDQLQKFGWAQISDEDAASGQAALVQEGWVREDAAEGVYITENPETAFAPVDGYGVTYLFTDGIVILSDTKQGLLLIEWPKAES